MIIHQPCWWHHSCDAEPDVLSNYVLALLKHEAPESELKETFRKQLNDFLDNGG
jgi:RNA-binding protein 26